MPDPSIDQLREQLRERGYLTHGIERWFALDPFRSRAFWLELITVALKAATLIALFGALPMAAVMVWRNHPLTPLETLAIFAAYSVSWLAVAFVFTVGVALLLKLRPALAIDTPRALLAISIASATLLVSIVGAWWYRFDAPPLTGELATGIALSVLFFLVSAIVVSAALLSFSIYESHRIPGMPQQPRVVPLAIAAAVLIGLLFVPARGGRTPAGAEPMVAIRPSLVRVALVAVDGLTLDIFESRNGFGLRPAASVPPLRAASTAERWATVGTGTSVHGVRAIEGVRFPGGTHLIQNISRADFALPLAGRREPLPPTVRRRDYVWEIVARRGITSAAVNWWTTADEAGGALESIGPESIFAGSQGDPLRLDAAAAQQLLEIVERSRPQFVTVYLPALDIVLNRRRAGLSASLRALDGIEATIAALRARGYQVVVAGLPGDGQNGSAVFASTLPLGRPSSALDIAPTLLDLLGFPLSSEMPGQSLTSGDRQPRIASYGSREPDPEPPGMNQEYYESLKSLGYVQ